MAEDVDGVIDRMMGTRNQCGVGGKFKAVEGLAIKSAFSCVSSKCLLLPFALAGRQQEQLACAGLLPVSPFIHPLVKEKYFWGFDNPSLLIENLVSSLVSSIDSPALNEKCLSKFDPALRLVERLDEGWFEDNIVGFQWWDICPLFLEEVFCPHQGPSTAELMVWAP